MITLIFSLLTQVSALEANAKAPAAKSAAKLTNPEFRPTIHAHNQIEVVAYDYESDTFKITWSRITAAESQLYVTPQSLVKGVHSLTLETLKKNPQGLVGNIYSTDADLDLVDHISLGTKKRFATIKPKPREPQSSRNPASAKPAAGKAAPKK